MEGLEVLLLCFYCFVARLAWVYYTPNLYQKSIKINYKKSLENQNCES